MSKPITAKINVTRILKEYLYEGKNGKYLDLVIWENRDGPDQYGNTHRVDQGLPKEARDAKVKAPILGNLKMPDEPQHRPAQRTAAPAARPAQRPMPPKDPNLDPPEDDIPF